MNRMPQDNEVQSASASGSVLAEAPASESAAPSRPQPGKPDPHKRPTIVAKPLSRKISSAFLKVIRRTHLYTGLLLLPWVLIFGLSGFLFNHEDIFRPSPEEKITRISQADLEKDLGFSTVDASVVASQVIEQLNAQAGEGDPKFKLVSGASLRGLLTLTAGGEVDGKPVRHTYTMNLNNGQAWVTTVEPVQNQPQTTTPPFAGKQVQVPAVSVDDLTQKVDDLTYELGIDSDGSWAMRGRAGGPEVRFVMQDDTGRDWHVSYNLMRGTLGGRAADENPSMDFSQAMIRLHKLHHYPTEFGMRWIWMLAADITALTMVFWGLSGLIMWWQLKPTRTAGILGVSIMAVVGFVIVMGVLSDMNFLGAAGRGRAPAPPAQAQSASVASPDVRLMAE